MKLKNLSTSTNQQLKSSSKLIKNRQGFSLIELLATIVILSVILGIASVGVISYINTSKEKTEKVFTDKLSRLIDDYLDLYGSTLSKNNTTYTFKKCRTTTCDPDSQYEVVANELASFTINDLVTANLIEEESLINPKNKKECFNTEKNPEIKVYKDSEYVYYYYVDLSGDNTTCDISDKNSLINTLPDDLIKSLKEKGVELPNSLKEKVGE